MRAVRDLRDLVNVSRLSYVDSDDETNSSNYQITSHYGFNTSYDFDDFAESTFKTSKLNSDSIYKSIENSINSLTDRNKLKKSTFNSIDEENPYLSSVFEKDFTKSSFFKDKSLLFDRNSKPHTMISLNNKKPLPPLKPSSAKIEKNIEPLPMNKNRDDKDTGNFDKMLTYIDASVVGEWLNRSNRSLRKMHKWHRDNLNIYEKSSNQVKNKYEPFIIFANFWLGYNDSYRFDHKQRDRKSVV